MLALAAEFAHPRANRRTVVAGCPVAYLLQRSRRRSIGFVVGAEGLSVRAPSWLAVREVDAALAAKADWVLRKLIEQRERAQHVADVSGVQWVHGATIPYLGRPLTLQCGGGPAGTRLVDDGLGQRRLHIGGLADNAGPADVRDRVRSWLQRDARRLFEERVRLWMPRLRVRCTRLGVSSARTRWGSASASGAIRLNWRLVHFDLDTVDYVVVHELAHLREMNHGPAFWAIVQAALPHHAQARQALRLAVLPNFDTPDARPTGHDA